VGGIMTKRQEYIRDNDINMIQKLDVRISNLRFNNIEKLIDKK
jgi:hypothetical protein